MAQRKLSGQEKGLETMSCESSLGTIGRESWGYEEHPSVRPSIRDESHECLFLSLEQTAHLRLGYTEWHLFHGKEPKREELEDREMLQTPPSR